MRSHLGCIGSVELGPLGEETQKRLEQVTATWLEYSPEAMSLVVRHVQPDDVPALREIAGELVDFLRALSDTERAQIPGGTLYYQDEPTGQYVRLRVLKGGYLTVAWALPDYNNAQWERFQNQPVSLVFEPYQKLNGTVSFSGNPDAAEDLRRILDKTAGPYSQGDFAMTSTVDRVELTLNDINADALTLVNALRYLAKGGTLTGQIDVSSFRTGDLEDYCRFVFRGDETWIARPALWSGAPDTRPAPETLKKAA